MPLNSGAKLVTDKSQICFCFNGNKMVSGTIFSEEITPRQERKIFQRIGLGFRQSTELEFAQEQNSEDYVPVPAPQLNCNYGEIIQTLYPSFLVYKTKMSMLISEAYFIKVKSECKFQVKVMDKR